MQVVELPVFSTVLMSLSAQTSFTLSLQSAHMLGYIHCVISFRAEAGGRCWIGYL
jgi:hypothetical protein